MTIKEIIAGLKFTVDMFLFDSSTGETYKEPRNDMDKTTIDACKGAIELLEQTRWVPVSERLPEEGKTVIASTEHGVFPEARFWEDFGWEWAYEAGADYWEPLKGVQAWMPLPQVYNVESEDKE
jgi:hypothetical protein